MMPRFTPADAPKSSALKTRYLSMCSSLATAGGSGSSAARAPHSLLPPLLCVPALTGPFRPRLRESNLREQPRRHRAGLEVLLRNRPRRRTVPPVVAVDRVDGRQRLLDSRVGEEPFTGGQELAEPRVLSDDRL